MPSVDHTNRQQPQQDGQATWRRFNGRVLARIDEADETGTPAGSGSAYTHLINTLRRERETDVTKPGSRRFVPHGDPSCLFCAAAAYLRPDYQANLVNTWLSALDGVVEKLFTGALAADLGCGHGHALMIMASAFPRSQFIGYDSDASAIAMARRHAARHGIANLHFQADPDRIAMRGFDLVTCFDSLHSLGDPMAMAARIRDAMASDGSWLILEQAGSCPGLHRQASGEAGPTFDNSQMETAALAAQIERSGFSRVHRAVETAAGVILEARF